MDDFISKYDLQRDAFDPAECKPSISLLDLLRSEVLKGKVDGAATKSLPVLELEGTGPREMPGKPQHGAEEAPVELRTKILRPQNDKK